VFHKELGLNTLHVEGAPHEPTWRVARPLRICQSRLPCIDCAGRQRHGQRIGYY